MKFLWYKNGIPKIVSFLDTTTDDKDWRRFVNQK